MAALRYILLAAAITLTLALLAHLRLPARAPLPRRTGRRGGLGIAALTAVYAVAAFWNLGSAHDPQRFCSFEAGESAVLALERETAVAAVWYYPGLSTGEYTLAYSTDGVTFTPAGTMPQGYADLFKWLQPEMTDAAPATAAYVRITAGAHMELGELALYDLQGDRIGVRDIAGPADADALCDEADTVPASSTYYNSTYFDEIYHARTAYEHLRGVYPYEVSHPPLGKEILSLGIALFGMTPFGWRCMGALFGVAMLPLMWDLLRRMFRDDRVALCGAALLACDFMHLTQTRIATIDSFATLFILLMYMFLYRYFTEGKLRHLAACGVTFGIGAAIPTHEISEDSGLIDAVSLMIGRTSGLFVGAVALLFLITLFGNMISWSMGVNSTAAYAAENGDMPAIFARRWAKNDMPIGSALTSGIVASVVCILGIIIELLSPDSSLFWSFFALNLVMLLLSYAPVFPAFLRLREIDPDSERPFRVPGGRGMLRVLAYVPMALILISIFFTAVPLSMDSETLSSYLPITIGSILSIVIGEILIAARARRHHS